MPDLWVPGSAADAILAEQETDNDEVRNVARRLKALDPRLGLFRARVDDPENELQAGFYYAYRHNEDGTYAFWEIRHPIHGGFYEPDEAVVEAFRRWDATTRGSSPADRARKREIEARKKEKREQDWRDRKAGEVREQADFLFRSQMAPLSVTRRRERKEK